MNRQIIPLMLLAVSLVVLLVSFLPAPLMNTQFDLDSLTIDPQNPDQTKSFIHLKVSYPRWVRLDETGVFQLRINTNGADSGSLQGWQARLEMNGVVIAPHGESRQRIIAGKETLFRWNIKPYKSEAGKGTLWVYSVRNNGSSQGEISLILAHPFEIRIISWMGGAGWMALGVIAAVGVVTGMVWFWFSFKKRP
jgi:hypothetical protein